MCKSQHAADVRFQHERCERKKIIKSIKEICAHLNLQPPSSSIASEMKKAQKLSHLKKGLLALTIRLRCSNGMEIWASAASALTMAIWRCIILSPSSIWVPSSGPLSWWWRRRGRWRRGQRWIEPLEDLPNFFLVINDKGGERSIKNFKA
jgi:hypothetical protein